MTILFTRTQGSIEYGSDERTQERSQDAVITLENPNNSGGYCKRVEVYYTIAEINIMIVV